MAARCGPRGLRRESGGPGHRSEGHPGRNRIQAGDATLEVNRIGKECHSHREIFHRVGDFIMPREGIFAKVLTGGDVREGDPVTVLAEEA